MFQIVRSILTGMPPVAPPVDNVPYIAAENIGTGCFVTVPGHTVAGKVGLAKDVKDVFGLSVQETAKDKQVRLVYIVPGMIFKAPADSELVAGSEAGINATADGVMGVGTGLRVLNCIKDSNNRYWAWVVLSESALSTERSTGAMITAFKFTVAKNAGLAEDLVGVIDHAARTIAVAAPAATVITALKANFATTEEATVKVGTTAQTSDTTSNNFTDGVKYDVTSSDGKKTVSYTATVAVAEA